MANFQIIGDKEKLSGGPKNALPHNGNNGQYQLIGTNQPLSQTPVPLQQGKVPNSGTFQNIGEKVSMSPTPHKGWDSAKTPMSDRAIAQSIIPGLKKS